MKATQEGKEGDNVIRITGNASGTLPVATELNWECLQEGNAESSERNTVVMIALESIYHGRRDKMKDVYQSA